MSSSSLTPPPLPLPHALTVEEIGEYVWLFATAAENAVLRARFDGVETHGANTYLVDQFVKSNTNSRLDAYGGSVRNRGTVQNQVRTPNWKVSMWSEHT
jgi:NADPH2 dehydrogenase